MTLFDPKWPQIDHLNRPTCSKHELLYLLIVRNLQNSCFKTPQNDPFLTPFWPLFNHYSCPSTTAMYYLKHPYNTRLLDLLLRIRGYLRIKWPFLTKTAPNSSKTAPNSSKPHKNTQFPCQHRFGAPKSAVFALFSFWRPLGTTRIWPKSWKIRKTVSKIAKFGINVPTKYHVFQNWQNWDSWIFMSFSNEEWKKLFWPFSRKSV